MSSVEDLVKVLQKFIIGLSYSFHKYPSMKKVMCVEDLQAEAYLVITELVAAGKLYGLDDESAKRVCMRSIHNKFRDLYTTWVKGKRGTCEKSQFVAGDGDREVDQIDDISGSESEWLISGAREDNPYMLLSGRMCMSHFSELLTDFETSVLFAVIDPPEEAMNAAASQQEKKLQDRASGKLVMNVLSAPKVTLNHLAPIFKCSPAHLSRAIHRIKDKLQTSHNAYMDTNLEAIV